MRSSLQPRLRLDQKPSTIAKTTGTLETRNQKQSRTSGYAARLWRQPKLGPLAQTNRLARSEASTNSNPFGTAAATDV